MSVREGEAHCTILERLMKLRASEMQLRCRRVALSGLDVTIRMKAAGDVEMATTSGPVRTRLDTGVSRAESPFYLTGICANLVPRA